MTAAQEKVKWKVRLWAQSVDRYQMRTEALESNKSVLYAMMKDCLSRMISLKSGVKKVTRRHTRIKKPSGCLVYSTTLLLTLKKLN